MTADAWRQVKSVFDLCVELPIADRPGFLDAHCAENDELRAEVESLLKAHDTAGEFIEEPPAAREAAPQRLGAWELTEEIGQGGMGAIYRARRADGQYEQQAAVKLLRRGMDTETILRHFQLERRILAQLDHPNIARLLDGGMASDGRPYFVMEYIAGEPIDRYVESRNLPVREQLSLFLQVCAAVDYAHQRLVVHRDIKPGNVLVTADGVPKLLDFGIAKIVQPGSEPQTVTSARMMTPDYASPEQLLGDPITTASDVYSLGVLLFQLLTGERPYRVKTRAPHELAQAICEQLPELPSTAAGNLREQRGGHVVARSKLLAGDLDAIVLKALEKIPGDRYSSVEQLSADIQRHLSGYPVHARKHTLLDRAFRYARRNAVSVTAASVVLAALIAGLGGTLWQARIARRERAEAESRFNELRKLARLVMFDFHDAIENLPGSTAARELLLRSGMEYLNRLSASAPQDPALRRELGEAYLRIGDLQGNAGMANLGLREQARQSYQKALEIAQSLPENDLDAQGLVARARQTLGGVENTRAAVATYERILAARPNDRKATTGLATAHFLHADSIFKQGDLAGSIAIRRKELAMRKDLFDADPALGIRNYALSSKMLGGLLIRAGKPEEALPHYQRALELEERWARERPFNAEARMAQSYSHSDIGYILRGQKKFRESLTHYRKTVEIREELHRVDSKNHRAKLSLVSAYLRTGHVHLSSGNAAEALALYQRGVALLSPDVPEDRKDLAGAYTDVGDAFKEAQRPREAEKWYARAKALAGAK